MKLQFGTCGSIEIKTYKTPIAIKWYNAMTDCGARLIQFRPTNQDKLALIELIKIKKKKYKDLVDHVKAMNEILKTFDVEHFSVYNQPEFTQSWFNHVHEKWVKTTLLIQDAQKYPANYSKQFLKLANILNRKDYGRLNGLTHAAEFHNNYIVFKIEYENSYYNFLLDSFDKIVTAEDTTWDPGFLQLPFFDVGRPQFEEWLLKGKVTEESSNFLQFNRRIVLRFVSGIPHTVPQAYIDAYTKYCNDNNLEIWKPYLALGDTASNNQCHMADNISSVLMPWIEESIKTDSFQITIIP